MRNHNKERPRKKDTTDEPRRTKPRMIPYVRKGYKTDETFFNDDHLVVSVEELEGDENYND